MEKKNVAYFHWSFYIFKYLHENINVNANTASGILCDFREFYRNYCEEKYFSNPNFAHPAVMRHSLKSILAKMDKIISQLSRIHYACWYQMNLLARCQRSRARDWAWWKRETWCLPSPADGGSVPSSSSQAGCRSGRRNQTPEPREQGWSSPRHCVSSSPPLQALPDPRDHRINKS